MPFSDIIKFLLRKDILLHNKIMEEQSQVDCSYSLHDYGIVEIRNNNLNLYF